MAENDKQQILVGIAFADVFRAQEFMTAALGMASRGQLVLEDRVLIVKDADGSTRVIGEDRKDVRVRASKVARAECADAAAELLESIVNCDPWAVPVLSKCRP